MSEKTALKEVEKQPVELQPAIIVGGNSKHSVAGLRKPRLLVGIVLLVLVGGAILALTHKSATPKPVVATKRAVDISHFTPEQKANYYVSLHNYTAAERVYNDQLKLASTPVDKAALYGSLATMELDAAKYAQAYAAAKQADTLNPTTQSAQLAGYAAQQNGDKPMAAHYYMLAISRYDATRPNSNLGLQNLKKELAEVQ